MSLWRVCLIEPEIASDVRTVIRTADGSSSKRLPRHIRVHPSGLGRLLLTLSFAFFPLDLAAHTDRLTFRQAFSDCVVRDPKASREGLDPDVLVLVQTE